MSGGVKYHVLLIGIDAYTVRPLRGCVNDIDAVQSLLVERAGISPARIKRLASPEEGTAHPTIVPEAPATLANIRAALADLGSERVEDGDRVLIYYSGHGAHLSVKAREGVFYREALVPVDFNEDRDRLRFLFDFELNRLLGAIALRTTSVCMILDCCHSAGATREMPPGPETRARGLDVARELKRREPVSLAPDDARGAGSDERGIGGPMQACLIVAACLDQELAQEDMTAAGVRHGVLTQALLSELARVDDADLRAVTWARIWQRTLAAVSAASPSQHPWIAGSGGRAVLAGPPVERDAGFSLRRSPGTSEYLIDAGALADVGKGARLAVYREEPAYFPRLGSPEDIAARASQSLLQVIRADRASAVAVCEQAPFDLPAGARARLVAVAPEDALRCAVVPPDEQLVAAVASSPLLRLTGEAEAQVRLEKRGSAWALTDDVHGARPEYPALVTIGPDDLIRTKDGLELYLDYSRPLRMAARCNDLPGALKISLLLCPKEGLSEAEAQGASLPEAPFHPSLTYALSAGDAFCVQVKNTSSRQLRVTLLNCAATGRVERCGDQVIEPGSFQRFWRGDTIGAPFEATTFDDRSFCIDRMVAIGTTQLGTDLRYLVSDKRFSDVIKAKRGGFKRIPVDGLSTPPVESWASAQITLAIEGEGAGSNAAPGGTGTRGRVTPTAQSVTSATRVVKSAEEGESPDPAELAAAPLRCAIVPRDEPLAALIGGSPVIRVVAEDEAEVLLSRLSDGRWLLSDDVGTSKRGYPALVTLRPEQLDRVRAVLELYYRYARPLRMAAHCTDLPGALKVTLLACPPQGIRPAAARSARLREAPRNGSLAYALKIGDAFCVEVENTSSQDLRVTLLNCAASGKVEYCDSQPVAARGRERLWCGEPGYPFIASEVRGNRRYVDRMVAIGTTLRGEDLGYLTSDSRFSELLDPGRARPLVDTSPPRGKWTASEVALEIGLSGGDAA